MQRVLEPAIDRRMFLLLSPKSVNGRQRHRTPHPEELTKGQPAQRQYA
jgi:hypothetical protein